MENLALYLSRTGKRQAAFAKEAGLSPGYLSEILSGAKVPGRAAIDKISRATAGAVPPNVWFERGDAA
jgi:transcriptional regulator with XRE-family HTH domain